MVHHLNRQAPGYQARGMNREAARYYREAAALACAHEGFDEEGLQVWLDVADRLFRRLLSPRPTRSRLARGVPGSRRRPARGGRPSPHAAAINYPERSGARRPQLL